MTKEIVFAGHFVLGEKITEEQKQTVVDALETNGKIAILVGDIGFT